MEERWVKLHSKLLEWEWFKDGYTLRVFIYMLFDASHKKEKRYGIDLEAGMVATNVPLIASMTQMSENWARRSLNNLLKTGELVLVGEKSSSRFRVYRIANWRKYQSTPHDMQSTSCTSQCEPHNVQSTSCSQRPHNVEGRTPPVDNYSNVNINIQEENNLSNARTRAREDVPSEWTKLANDLWNAYPRKQDMIPSLSAVIRAIEREGDFGTFKALATTAVAKFAEITAKWKQADRRYIPKMSTFFDNASYRDDPSSWERNDKPSHGGYDFTGMKPVTQEELDGTTEVF